MQQCFSWWCFDALNPTELFLAAQQMGFMGIELVPEELFGLAKQHNLKVITHRGHESIEHGLNDPSQHARIEKEIVQNLKLAETWGIPNLIVFSGNRNELGDEAGLDATVKILTRLAPLAEGAGINLLLELLNSRLDHPNYLADSTNFGVQVCEAVSSQRVKLLFDIYHMRLMGEDVNQKIDSHSNWFEHYHTAGVPGRGELVASPDLDYETVKEKILSTAYTGFVGHEFVPRTEPIAALRAAYKLFD